MEWRRSPDDGWVNGCGYSPVVDPSRRGVQSVSPSLRSTDRVVPPRRTPGRRAVGLGSVQSVVCVLVLCLVNWIITMSSSCCSGVQLIYSRCFHGTGSCRGFGTWGLRVTLSSSTYGVIVLTQNFLLSPVLNETQKTGTSSGPSTQSTPETFFPLSLVLSVSVTSLR